MIKVHISPSYIKVPRHVDNGGIRRVSEALIKYLPAFGVEHVENPKEADVIVNHGADLLYVAGKPNVNINHGMMWSRQPWGEGMQEVNALLVESMARAVAHTAPSQWVSRAIRRGGLWYPEVVYHGVEKDEFQPGASCLGYVLWNKARADYVSDPNDMQHLAASLPHVPFLSTIGTPTPNVRITGVVSYEDMHNLAAQAGVYLCTTRETFGIGTLEAMACGVPVAGWDWGGQSEIVVQGQTGYLAPPGDFRALADCVERCLAERGRLGANARADVEARWGWEKRIEQYAGIFKRVYEKYSTPRPDVSVIVTTYHLDEYLPVALDSVLKQVGSVDWECIVVDDVPSHRTWKIVESYTQSDPRFRYVPVPHNLGLPGARNYGFDHARGRYIRHLDADDWLAPDALQLETTQLDAQPGQHIVYGHLEVVNEDGSRMQDEKGNVPRSGWPPNQFDWVAQMAHLNQIPSCAMARREVFERSGGYRPRMKRNEDAEFWCRTTSLGFRAWKFTQAVTYYHRARENSKGATEWKREGKEPDWTAWFPWRVGSYDLESARQILRKFTGNHPSPFLVPFGAQGQAPGRRFWYVHDFSRPVVSIVVTVGPGHESYLLDALDSIWAQSYPDWECVVVNDTGREWDADIMGAPWARVVSTGGNRGASAARNAGYRATDPHSQWIVWMDGDDIWLPWYLEVMVAHAERNNGVIFSDCLLDRGEGGLTVHRFQDFSVDALAANMRYAGTSVLVPRRVAQAVYQLQGGWDEVIPGKEDHDWQIAVHSLEFCAYHVPEPLFLYRMWTTTKREKDFAQIDIIEEYLTKKWRGYRLEGKRFMCGCGSTTMTSNKPASLLASSGKFEVVDGTMPDGTPTQLVTVKYVGPRAETFSIRSVVMPDKMYRFGNNQHHQVQTVFLADAERLLGMKNGEVPQWEMVTHGASMDSRDPAVVLGQTITG